MISRVRLRPPEPHDAEELVRLNRVSRALHRGWVDPPRTARSFLTYCARVHDPRQAPRLVSRRADRVIVGVINLSEIVRGNFRSAYLGYYIGSEFAGQGYMTEALSLMLRYAFGPAQLHRVEANIQSANTASIALVRRGGFVLEGLSRRYLKIDGRWRDHERWAILAETWRRAKRKRRHP